MRVTALAALPAMLLLTAAAQPAAKPKTPNDIIAAAPKADWREIPASDLMQIELGNGSKVIIQLAPKFAPVHVSNIKALAGGGWWDGAAIYRVQDNYVVQWGNNESERPFPAGVVAKPPAEYWRSSKGLTVNRLPYRDSYATAVGIVDGWPVGIEPKAGQVNLTHCYGMVGVGRDLTPDTGTGGELYAIIGHAPRQLDRNIALVGRVVSGFEAMATLQRGPAPMGFYPDRKSDTPIKSTRIVSELPVAERPRFEYLGGPSFQAYVTKRANRKDDFYDRPAGGVDICNINVPVRPVPTK